MPSVGIGLRLDIIEDIEARLPCFDVLEVIADHYLDTTVRNRRRIEALAKRVPLVLHGLRLSLGSSEMPEDEYLEAVARVADRLGARFYSEHLAFTHSGGLEVDELLPIPFNEESLEVVSRNISYAQRKIGCPLLIENIPKAFEYTSSSMGEASFMNRVCEITGAKVLLDLENAYADQMNWGRDAAGFSRAIDCGHVMAIHLAGGKLHGHEYVDDHSHDIPRGVLELLDEAIARHRGAVIIVERDGEYENASLLEAEVGRVRSRLAPNRVNAENADVS